MEFPDQNKEQGIIKYYTTFAYNQSGSQNADIDSLNLKNAFNLANHNWYNNLSWRQHLNNGWKMTLTPVTAQTWTIFNSSRSGILLTSPHVFPDSVFWMQ